MKAFNEIFHKSRILYIKFMHWEYWPMWLIYFPVSFYYIFLSIKAKSLFFFSGVNPSIERGGMFFESKWKIFELIPKEYFPTTIYISTYDSIENVLEKMDVANIKFPVIAKPDRGERGWLVQKIESVNELKDYCGSINIDFLIQSYVEKPMELSIFFYKNPNNKSGIITSVALKKLLTVTGDGIHAIDYLIKDNQRSFLQYKRLKKKNQIDFESILPLNAQQVIVPYGNHALGAMFLNYQQIIDKELINTFNLISDKIDKFYYGRFDIRCNSLDDLKNAENISILELNGAGAEPAHIYDPSFSFFKAQLVLAKHFKMMYETAMENKKRGFVFMTCSMYLTAKKKEKNYKLKALRSCI